MLSDLRPHASEEVLEAYAMGTLGEAEVASLEEHLLVCGSCQDHLAEADAFIRATRQAVRNLQAAPPQLVVAGAPWWRLPRLAWGPALAGLVVLLGIGGWWGLRHRPGVPPVAVALESLRGDNQLAARAPSGRALLLRVDLTGVTDSASLELEVVSAQGRPVHRETIRRTGAAAEVSLTGLDPGQYWVRLYAQPQRELLREFGLRVE